MSTYCWLGTIRGVEVQQIKREQNKTEASEDSIHNSRQSDICCNKHSLQPWGVGVKRGKRESLHEEI